MKKMLKMIREIGLWFNDKKIMKGMAAFFVSTMIPMFVVAKYSKASADDFGWNAGMRRQIWNETHSFLKLLITSIQNTKDMYIGWQGTFATTFVQAFQPEIFNIRSYFIVPYIMIPFFCGGTALLLYYIFVRLLKIKKSIYGIVTFLYFLITIQYIPSTGEAFYWFNGAVAYTLAYSIMLFSLCFSLDFIFSGKKRMLLFAVCTAFFVGGGNYLTIVLFPLLMILIFFLFVPSRKHTLCLFLPLSVFAITAIINMKAPGTQVRGGSGFGFDIHNVFTAIYKSIYTGLKVVRSDILGNPVILILMILVTLFIIAGMAGKRYEFQFKYPLLFVIMTFGSYLAMYAPTFYAGVGTPFGRLANLILFYLILSLIMNIVYVTGYLLRIIREKMGEDKEELLCSKYISIWNTYKIYIIFLIVLVIGINSHWYSTTAVVRTVKYLASGEAAQFGIEMDRRYEILLDENVKNVEIEPLTVSAGTLFLYDIVEDADQWPNTAVAEFFQKESVRLKQ